MQTKAIAKKQNDCFTSFALFSAIIYAKSHPKETLSSIACKYGINKNTLTRRVKGTQKLWDEAHANEQLFDKALENAILKCISKKNQLIPYTFLHLIHLECSLVSLDVNMHPNALRCMDTQDVNWIFHWCEWMTSVKKISWHLVHPCISCIWSVSWYIWMSTCIQIHWNAWMHRMSTEFFTDGYKSK